MEDLLKDILTELKAQRELKLGFCEPPEVRTIHANRQYPDCLWYFWNGGTNTHEPIESRAIVGVIEKLEIKDAEFKGKITQKVCLTIRSDRPYVIQSGMDALFAKGLLYTLSKLPESAFASPIMIAAEAGTKDDKALFCRIYNPVTGASVYAPYGDTVDWTTVADRAMQKINKSQP